MFDTVRWVCQSSPASCSTLSGGCVGVLQPHVYAVRWTCQSFPASCSTLSGRCQSSPASCLTLSGRCQSSPASCLTLSGRCQSSPASLLSPQVGVSGPHNWRCQVVVQGYPVTCFNLMRWTLKFLKIGVHFLKIQIWNNCEPYLASIFIGKNYWVSIKNFKN